ncbi:MAG: hypothetical protein STSR0009_27390 [Methanoregula sp.]
MINFEDWKEKFRQELNVLEIDNREMQTIGEYFEYLNKTPLEGNSIKEILMSTSQIPEKPDLYLFTDTLQIKIPYFPKFSHKSSKRLDEDRKSKYEINSIKKSIVSINIEIIDKTYNNPRTVKIDYQLKSGATFSIIGTSDYSTKLEKIANMILLPNLEN